MFILVCGTRTFNNYNFLRVALGSYLVNKDLSTIHIITGGARGADSLGTEFANRNGISNAVFPANWGFYGKTAGYKRNKAMAEIASLNNGVVIAFWDGKSVGTKMMIDLAKEYNLPTYIYKI